VQNTNPKSEVGKQTENQQDRIAQGIKSGQWTAGEAAHLEGHEAAINREIHNDRAANGERSPLPRRHRSIASKAACRGTSITTNTTGGDNKPRASSAAGVPGKRDAFSI
jgi:hypothetical protein